MIATEECGRQSKTVGIDSLAYLLPHPSMHSTTVKDNRTYGASLKLKWAVSAMRDLLVAFPLSMKVTRKIAGLMLNDEQKKTLAVYKKAKAAFVKGGGFLHAYGGIADTYKIYFFLYHINLALSMGIPVYVMPNSYGPFVDNVSKRMVQRCLSRCRIVYSRESISKQVLKNECGIDSKLSRDLAMYLEKDVNFDAEKYIKKCGIEYEPGKMVGITVRPYRFPGVDNPDDLYDSYRKAICDFILWLFANDYHPVLIEHVYSENYHERDIICINEISEMVRTNGKKVDIFSALELNCRQMKSIYSKLDFLVGTRFHSVIFSLTENIPVIAISYGGNKGDGIMRDLSLEKYCIPIDKVSSDNIINTFISMTSDIQGYKKSLERNTRDIKASRDTILEEISKNRRST